ncbi:MAG: peptidase U32 [Alphaproteobacteria bacterium]|nr:peptidase U32 [Alphaproteobacteria bacterium]
MRSELLLPAGSLSKLKTAILYGADAVYAGLPDLSLRVQSKFTIEELIEGVKFAHDRGKRIYLTLNLFTHNRDIEKLPKFLETIRKVNPDGIIASDPGVLSYFIKHAPEIDLHVSTQANVCSWLTVDYWKEQGARMCVLGREVTYKELCEIREKCQDIKIEAFVHGAMCMSYSGRCLISNYLAGRSANQGKCAHSCRWKYHIRVKLKDGLEKVVEINEHNKDMFEMFVEEEMRQGEYLPIEEDERGGYLFNSKDMCLMPKLDEILKIGIDSLKIEGRNKSEYYAATTARAYRQAIDSWKKDPENWKPDAFMKELYPLQNRGFTLGFHEGELKNISHNYDATRTVGNWVFSGVVREWQGDDMIFEARNSIDQGDVIEFLVPDSLKLVRLRLDELVDDYSGEKKVRVSAGQGAAIRIPLKAFAEAGVVMENDTDTVIGQDDLEYIKDKLPLFTVARKEIVLNATYQEIQDKNAADFSKETGINLKK